MNNLFKLLILLLMVCSCSGVSDDARFHSISKKNVEKNPDYFILDPIVGHVHKSNVTKSCVWPEHKDGKFTLKTNNYGFRKDSDIIPDKQGKIRILVTGDSHIDGLINNSESCCTILENLLNESIHDKCYEAINSGAGYYCPRNYVGIIKKYLYLAPDIYIVIIYGGNDFIETCRLVGCKRSINPYYYLKVKEVAWINPGVTQGLNQIYYFKNFPESQEIAFKSVTDDIKLIKEICESNRIMLIVLLLPDKMGIEWSTDELLLNRSKELLKLTNDDLQINMKLLNRMSAWLNNNKINYLNLYDNMKDKNSQLFWNIDYHLNDNGHKVIAETLFATYKDKFFRISKSKIK